MKLLLMLSLSVLMYLSSEAQQDTEKTGTLHVKLENVNVKKGGKIYIAVFDKKEHFMTQNRSEGQIVEVNAQDEFSKLTFKDIPYGDYVISAFHDTNGNGEMDFDQNGMPIEDWAMSGNLNPFGPPSWEGAKIEFRQEKLELKLNFQK